MKDCNAWPGWIAATLLTACLLLLREPYLGIWHDSTLYLGQALAHLHPETFRHDLFFAYGSQASFTALPAALAWLVTRFSAGTTFLWLTLSGLALFCAASWILLRRLLPSPFHYYGLLALLLLPASYGAWNTLHYLEPFLTGRTLAEPAALAALAALLARRYWTSALAAGLALAIHPLQVLPILVIAWSWLALGDKRWLHVLWLLPVAAIACLLIPKSAFLFTRIDPVWHAQIWQRSPIVFYSNSGPADWYYLLTDFFIAGVALRHAQGALRRYLTALLLANALLLGSGLLLADQMRLAWPTALQLWRAHWLLHWSAMAVLPWLCVHVWKHEFHARTLVFFSILVLGGMPGLAHPFTSGAVLLYLIWPWLDARLGLRARWACALPIAAIAALHAGNLLWTLVPAEQGLSLWSWLPLLGKALQSVLLVLAAVLLLISWKRLRQQHRWPAVLLLIPCLAMAGVQWDQRSLAQRSFTGFPPHRPFGVDIAPSQQVFWMDNLLPAWSVLMRPSYLDSRAQQLSGIVFNRGTSVEAYRRKHLLQVHDKNNRDCRLIVSAEDAHMPCRPDDVAVHQACARTKGELAFFVLPYPLESAPAGTWQPPAPSKGRYYLYSCKDMLDSIGEGDHARQ